MALYDLAPWNWGSPMRKRRASFGNEENPIVALQQQMNGLFNEMLSGFGLESWGNQMGQFVPHINVEDSETELKVKVEAAGMSKEDLEISFTPEALTIRGEKREDRDEKKGTYKIEERRFGSFQRMIPLYCEIEEDKIDASAKDGVITIVLPKKKGATSKVKKVSVR